MERRDGWSNEWPHVAIVGGGFGGLYAARRLARYPVNVTLVDRHNYHLFQPLLYQVATAALSPGDIGEPIRAVLRRARNVRVLLGEAQSVDLGTHRVLLEDGELSYDYLILAAGARHSYFGHDEWEPNAPGLKTLDDALEIRRRILLAFEQAEREADPALRAALLTFVVVGGGPTGVELAGAIAEIARYTMAHDFRSIDPTHARILLLEGGTRILSTFPPDLSAAAVRDLRRLGVEVRTNAVVTHVTPEAVHVGEETIPAWTTLWAAGVTASPLGRSLGVPTDRLGRVVVEPDLTVPGHPDVFVVGDLAAFPTKDGKTLPGLAPVALQEGEAAADNIGRSIRGEPRAVFRYVDRGTMATIGRAAAIAEVGRLKLSGFVAWLMWLFVHILWLIGFDNRVLVLFRWTWSYLTWERGARLITGPWPGQSQPVRGGRQRSSTRSTQST